MTMSGPMMANQANFERVPIIPPRAACSRSTSTQSSRCLPGWMWRRCNPGLRRTGTSGGGGGWCRDLSVAHDRDLLLVPGSSSGSPPSGTGSGGNRSGGMLRAPPRKWGIHTELTAVGDFSEVVSEYAEAMAGDGMITA